MILNFYLRFSTKPGQTLYVSGNYLALANDSITDAIPMQYFNAEFWYLQIEITDDIDIDSIAYHYIFKEEDGNEIVEWGNDRVIEMDKIPAKEAITLLDTWNHSGEIENAFFTKPFQEVLLKNKSTALKAATAKGFTHEFRVKAPLLQQDEVLCISGTGTTLGDWNTEMPVLLFKSGNWWKAQLNFTSNSIPVAYKYGVYNIATKKFIHFESGNNRTLPVDTHKGKSTIIHDGFVHLKYPDWKGAGVAIPVFSLRSKNSLGSGEFTDITLLVDWAKKTGLKLIQLLPINDTTANHTWTDSYPYAAISAFALHPIYLNIEKIAGKKNAALLKELLLIKQSLNALPDVDYDAVMVAKIAAVTELYQQQKEEFKKDKKFIEFFKLNRHWLLPYAAFCYLRDKYSTADFNQWKTNAVYDEKSIQQLVAVSKKHYDDIAIHYFIQYHLHLQLKDATAYAHKNGIVVKGDLPIGIYRYGCDAWMAPELYNMNEQAGAPPDDFAVKGQNWGFPTYNWKKMQEDGFAWWRQRFEQMSEYFDTFRIDHILGFFRIWSIPVHAVDGIMGRFVPAIPVHINELHKLNISFNHHRYCKPYITQNIVNDKFASDAEMVISTYLQWQDGLYELKENFNTQRKVEAHFNQLEISDQNTFIKDGLMELISNVIFFDEAGPQQQEFHFRFNMEQTSSFKDLGDHDKQQLKNLYVDYFFRRQDDFWKQEAMHKLPGLKQSTNMLVCGEDLGLVPACVPDVMSQLGLLSLEIQRMPKDSSTEFFHPANAPYLSVVTPATHDMSTIRGWWEESFEKSQRFYNTMLGHYGEAPFFCTDIINKEIVLQHLYSPAMWSIFQLQDLLGMSEKLRRENPNDERINIPSNPKHYWRYRMHISLEDLIEETEFNSGLMESVKASGR